MNNKLSLIICSRKQKIKNVLLDNINETIGCDFELIIIDNSSNCYSIFEAYNLGIERSKGRYLCFMHDDIFFHTNNWGSVIKNIFLNDSQVGLIGVAGAKIKTRMPSAWWDCENHHKVINLIQHFNNKTKKRWDLGFCGEDKSKGFEEVVAIDGVLMFAKRDNRIKFDSSFGGFHNYDINLSLEYKKFNYKNIVTKKVLIEHFSIGKINPEWYNSTFKIYNKYYNLLPMPGFNENLEIKNAKKFIHECIKINEYKKAYLIWKNLLLLKPISKFHLKYILLNLKILK